MIINENYREELITKINSCPETYFNKISREEILKDDVSLDLAAYWFQKNHEEYGCDYEWSLNEAIKEHLGIYESHNYKEELVNKIQSLPDSCFTVSSKEEILKNKELIDLTVYWIKICHETQGSDYEFALRDAMEVHLGICFDSKEESEVDSNNKILTIKDFAAGDEAWVLLENFGTTKEPSIHKTKILSVGRKYVTLDSIHKAQFANCESNYLREKTSFGEARLLFKTERKAKEYIEKQELNRWISNLSWTKVEKYSLKQLRKVKKILEPSV